MSYRDLPQPRGGVLVELFSHASVRDCLFSSRTGIGEPEETMLGLNKHHDARITVDGKAHSLRSDVD